MKDKPQIAIYEGFEKIPKEFSLDWLKSQGNVPVKHVQLYVQGEPILRIGGMYHKNLLEKTLKEFGLEFGFGPLPMLPSEEGPLMFGKNYEMVGSGKIKLLDGGNFDFSGASSHYSTYEKPIPTNQEHFEKLGFNLIEKGVRGVFNDPFYIVSRSF